MSLSKNNQNEEFCPITNLPIQTDAKWQDIKVNEDYRISYKIVGSDIMIGTSHVFQLQHPHS